MSDTTIAGFITRYGRWFHTTEQCPKYRYGTASATLHGRTIHPRSPMTAAQAQVLGRSPCRTC